MKELKIIKKVRLFLEFYLYYIKFIKNFLKIVKLMIDLVKKYEVQIKRK
jgi:hypothetical protein